MFWLGAGLATSQYLTVSTMVHWQKRASQVPHRVNLQASVPLFPQAYCASSCPVPRLTILPSVIPAVKPYGSHEAANSNMHLQSLHTVCLVVITSSRWYIRYSLPTKWKFTQLLEYMLLQCLCTSVTHYDSVTISYTFHWSLFLGVQLTIFQHWFR